MTDNEIIKALECCEYCQEDCQCCPLLETEDCYTALRIKTLDLINRQKAEIERLKNEKVKHHLIATVVIDEDVLKKFVDEGLKKVECDIIKVRNETIKEFAERLKESPRKISMMSFTKEEISTYVPVHAIDSLVKEMTEGKYAGKDI